VEQADTAVVEQVVIMVLLAQQTLVAVAAEGQAMRVAQVEQVALG
jgi:hypothetical protein